VHLPIYPGRAESQVSQSTIIDLSADHLAMLALVRDSGFVDFGARNHSAPAMNMAKYLIHLGVLQGTHRMCAITDLGRQMLADKFGEHGPNDIVSRIRGRIHDAPMPTERLLDDAADEIEQLRETVRLLREVASHYQDAGDLRGEAERDLQDIRRQLDAMK
jgi:hypothetical protein